jgi:hypothetical protein
MVANFSNFISSKYIKFKIKILPNKAGCDHRLGSDMKRDICGVCGGDGGSCREFKGIYNDRGTFGKLLKKFWNKKI